MFWRAAIWYQQSRLPSQAPLTVQNTSRDTSLVLVFLTGGFALCYKRRSTVIVNGYDPIRVRISLVGKLAGCGGDFP
jgi:hypothetical protein